MRARICALLALPAMAAAAEALTGRWSSTRVAGSGAAAAAAAPPAAAAVRPAAAAARLRAASGAAPVSGGSWPTEHHDTENSGATAELGPISGGECVVPFFGLAADTPVRFYSTGVTAGTPGANAHFFGGSDNALRVVVKNATLIVPGTSVSTAVYVSTCPLAPLRAGNTAAEAWGVVASGATWTAADGATDRLALASADGTVYGLNWQACVANASVCNTTLTIVEPANLGSGSGSGSGSAAAAGACVAWTFKSPADSLTGFPFLTPPRTYYAANLSATLVLATDTAKGGLNTGATTYALSGETGALVWQHKHAAVNGTWYGSFGAVAAYDRVDNIVFLAYGPGLVALDGSTGVQLGAWAGAGDIVVASPTITVPDNGAGAWSVFLHTSLGSLWSLSITQSAATGAVTFSPEWRCDYALATYWATGKGTCATFSSASSSALVAAAAAEVVEAPALHGSGAAPAAAPAPRLDYGAEGGFPQPTTRGQRDALWADIRARYAAAFPAGPASPLRAEHTAGLPGGVDASALEASLMLAALPRGEAAAVRSGSAGHGGLLAASAPALAGAEYAASFPYAAPTLLGRGGQVALAQFTALGSAAAGLFVVSAATGAPAWAYANYTLTGAFNTKLLVGFGRSRATPTVDGAGNLFVSSDSTVATIANDTIPYTIALAPSGGGYAVKWLANLGQAQVNLLGSASPIVRSGLLAAEPELYSASFQGAVALVPGQSCPVVAGYECGPARAAGGGTVQGSCNCATGVCACPRGFGLACFQGSGCGDSCSGNGQCSEVAANGTYTPKCACSQCWSGPSCSVYTCGGGAAAKPFLSTPAGAAAVGVPVALALALGLALAWWRVANPSAPWPCARGAAASGATLLERESVRSAYDRGGYGSVATSEK